MAHRLAPLILGVVTTPVAVSAFVGYTHPESSSRQEYALPKQIYNSVLFLSPPCDDANADSNARRGRQAAATILLCQSSASSSTNCSSIDKEQAVSARVVSDDLSGRDKVVDPATPPEIPPPCLFDDPVDLSVVVSWVSGKKKCTTWRGICRNISNERAAQVKAQKEFEKKKTVP